MLTYILSFSAAFILSIIFTPLVRLFALKNRFVSYPRADRWHKMPTALLGGVSIYLSTIITVSFFYTPQKGLWGFLIGSTILFLVGLADDKLHFTPYAKLFTQIVSGAIAVSAGIVIGFPKESIFAIPLTLIWIVGVTNAFNLLDNIDGLAVGIAAISSLTLFFSSYFVTENPLAIYCLIIAGACLGFLPYNFNPAKIFMGDSGSMFIGYSLAIISITGTANYASNLIITMLIPVLILSVPIFDTIFVMIVRKLQGRKIFEGGKDHTSHRLVTLGLSQRNTVILLYTISIVFGILAILYLTLNTFIIAIIAILAAITLLLFGIFLFDVTTHNQIMPAQAISHSQNLSKTILNGILMHKRRVVEVLLDFILICVAYYAAYFLRFEETTISSNLYLIKESLPWIILIKLSIFFICGLYRGIWRYISVSDFLTIFKAVTLGSISSVLFLTFAFRFKDYSRAIFIIDWLVLLFLALGARFLFRILSEFFSRFNKEEGKNVLIIGAGDAGEMVIREIKRNKTLNYTPVGFIDDNPAKLGNKIQGVPVLGGRDKIRNIIETKGIQELIIAIPSLKNSDLDELSAICDQYRISYQKVMGIFSTTMEQKDKL